jgi:hypothetical protein
MSQAKLFAYLYFLLLIELMSSNRTLRPPPNIDFIQGQFLVSDPSPHSSLITFTVGYPGIPPGAPDRLQAAVKGVSFASHRLVFPSEPKNSNQAIEVRLGPQGVKAKYVRVELRKIETIPGLPPNSYYDFVGQSPVNLWRSSEEYSMLHSVRLFIAVLSVHILVLALTL